MMPKNSANPIVAYATTKDGKPVEVGDKVWVRGSVGVHESTVLAPVTNYNLFGPIPVAEAFSSKEAALAVDKPREKKKAKEKAKAP
jgi:hypothetical protein